MEAIYEFVGSKPKMYSILDINNYEKSIHKGHNSNIKYDEFKDTLFNKNVIRHNMKGIKPFNHRILMKAIKYLYPLLMIKDIFLMME